MKIPKRWCIRHANGWCASVSGRRAAEPNGNATTLPTLCKQTITLPLGIEWRVPDCGDCVDIMRQDESGWHANHKPRAERRRGA